MPDAPTDTQTATDDWEISNAGTSVRPRRRKDAKDWAPLRALAQKRARITLTPVWQDAAKGSILYRADFRRFCYRDYAKHRTSLAIAVTPHTLGIRTDRLEDGKRTVLAHYIVSFKGGRLALYSRRVGTNKTSSVHRCWPWGIKLNGPIKDCLSDYPAAAARFNRRVTKLLRSAARANGVKLPNGESLTAVLAAGLYPALEAVNAHHKAVRGTDWQPGQNATDRWLMRHLRCDANVLPKSLTGYGSKAVTRLVWEAMKPTPLPAGLPPWTQTPKTQWRDKWAWCALLRSWMPVDYVQQLLRAERIAEWDDTFTATPGKVRRFLKRWTPAQVLRALTDTCADNNTIRDTIRMLDDRGREPGTGTMPDPRTLPPLPRTNGPLALHEWLVDERNREQRLAQQRREERRLAEMSPEARAEHDRIEAARNAEETAPFTYSEQMTERMAAAHGRTVITASDGTVHTLLVPQHAQEMVLWGAAMHNCIGGYAYYVRLGQCQILGVRSEGSDKPVAWGIELRDHAIVQFRGICNVEAPLELKAAVERVLKEAGLIEQLTVGELTATLEDGAYEALAQVAGQEVAA